MISYQGAGWHGYTLHLFEFGISNHGVSNCVIYVHRLNAGYDYGPGGGGECSLDVCGRRTGGVNGRFIYHRCHSPPERKSALPNWNIAEFTLLIRALSAVLSPRLSSNWEQQRLWQLIASGLMWPRLTATLPSKPATHFTLLSIKNTTCIQMYEI